MKKSDDDLPTLEEMRGLLRGKLVQCPRGGQWCESGCVSRSECVNKSDPHALLRDKLRELAERWATSASENHQLAMQGYPSDRESYAEIYRDCARELSALIEGDK